MMNKKGRFFTLIGLLLIGAALTLTIYNIYENHTAKQRADEILQQVEAVQAENLEKNTSDEETDASVALVDDRPLYEKYPDMEMPVTVLDGIDYIGTIEIPALNLKLPVISEWSYPNLRIAPCRYKGSAYKDDLILAAHNYSSHFGEIKNLQPGDEVIFYDAELNCFTYEVIEKEVLDGTAIEEMEAGDWDLTLFTCTYGGRTRETIRCVIYQP